MYELRDELEAEESKIRATWFNCTSEDSDLFQNRSKCAAEKKRNPAQDERHGWLGEYTTENAFVKTC